MTKAKPAYSRTISRREQRRLEQIGFKRAFCSGHRALTEEEFDRVSEFRLEYKTWHKALGVDGRREIRIEAEASPHKFGVTEFDCAGWSVVLEGDSDRFSLVLNENVNILEYAKYWNHGVLDDELIIKSIKLDISPEDAFEMFKRGDVLTSKI